MDTNKEICIRCGKETEYDVGTSVSYRRYYIEGSGQLCQNCFQLLYPMPGALGNKNLSEQGVNDASEKS